MIEEINWFRSERKHMSFGFRVMVGDALFIPMPQGDLYLLVRATKPQQLLNMDGFLCPSGCLINGVIDTFSIVYREILLDSHRPIYPLNFISQILLEKTNDKAFKNFFNSCPNKLETYVGNYNLFRLSETVDEEKFKIHDLKHYFNNESPFTENKTIMICSSQPRIKNKVLTPM